MKRVLLFISLLSHGWTSSSMADPKKASWPERLRSSLKLVEKGHPEGTFGVYVKNLNTGHELSRRGDETWYVASGTKIPLAIATYQALDAGRLRLTSKAILQKTDYIDGAGELNYLKPGSQVSIRLLLDQTLTWSDNTASDILFQVVGLDQVNALVAKETNKGFHPITNLIEVRKQVYGHIHPATKSLTNMDYVRLKTLKTDEDRRAYLVKRLKLKPEDLKLDFGSAYDAYYAGKLNSASLRGFGTILEKLAKGKFLKPDSQKRLLDTMERIETGKKRLKAGFSPTSIFAHKTGTQHHRQCDMGILRDPQISKDQIVVVACVKNTTPEKSEKIFRQIGTAIRKAQVFTKDQI